MTHSYVLSPPCRHAALKQRSHCRHIRTLETQPTVSLGSAECSLGTSARVQCAAAAALTYNLPQPLGRRAEAQMSPPGLPAGPYPAFRLSSPFSLPLFSTFHSAPLRDPSFHQQISVLFVSKVCCVCQALC